MTVDIDIVIMWFELKNCLLQKQVVGCLCIFLHKLAIIWLRLWSVCWESL